MTTLQNIFWGGKRGGKMQGVTSVCFVGFENESSEVLEMQACLDWMFLL